MMADSDDDDAIELTLEEFVTTNPLPQRAKVTVGYDDPYNSDNSFSTSDVIEANRLLCPFVSLTYIDSRKEREVRVTVPTSNQTRFRFATPQTPKPRVYSTVKQLVNAWPLVIVARSDHDDAQPAFFAGDKLRLIRLDRSYNGKTAVLELKNLATLELVRLPFTYAATFAEAEPADSRLYTLGELVQIARVPRQLVLRHDDHDSPEAWVPGIPLDFSGYVWVEKPDYLVEVQAVTVEDSDNNETNRFLVSIDSDITVVACESDYVTMSHLQCYLQHLDNQPSGVFPRIVSVLRWKEETTILQNHFVRPGERLVLYSLETVRKLAVRVCSRRFFVPLDHPALFGLCDTNTEQRRLHELISASTKFPLMLKLSERGNYVNMNEETLPKETVLRAETIVEERSVVAAKLDRGGRRLQPAFRLPLRTKIELHFYGRWKKSNDPPSFSRWDCVAEEVSKSVYHAATGMNWSGKSHRQTVDFAADPAASERGVAHGVTEVSKQNKTKQCQTEGGTAPCRPLNAPAGDVTSAVSCSDKRPPLFARNMSLTLTPHRRPPPPLPTSHSPPLPPPRQTSNQLSTSVPNTEDEDSNDEDAIDYESIDSDDDYETISNDYRSPVIQTESLNIPVDGNVSQFTVEQLQQLMQQLSIPTGTLSEWHELRVDGRAFAEMTDSQLATYSVALPLVMYFRDRSRLNVLTRL